MSGLKMCSPIGLKTVDLDQAQTLLSLILREKQVTNKLAFFHQQK